MSTRLGEEKACEQKWGVEWFLQADTTFNVTWTRPSPKPALYGYVTDSEWADIPEGVRQHLKHKSLPSENAD